MYERTCICVCVSHPSVMGSWKKNSCKKNSSKPKRREALLILTADKYACLGRPWPCTRGALQAGSWIWPNGCPMAFGKDDREPHRL